MSQHDPVNPYFQEKIFSSSASQEILNEMTTSSNVQILTQGYRDHEESGKYGTTKETQ